MTWDEWERLKADKADRHATHMRIDHLPADGGSAKPGAEGSGPDLRIGDTPWTKAASVAKALQTSTQNGLHELTDSDNGIGGNEGFDCTAAVKEIQPTWEARLKAVRVECGRLHGTLRTTGKHFGEVDHGVKKKTDTVHLPTPEWAR